MTKIKRTLKYSWPLVFLFLTSCGKEAERPQNTLDPKGYYAQIADDLWRTVFPIALFVFVLVQALVIIVVIKYRRKSDDESPKQVHGNSKLELTWTILPALLLAFVGVRTVTTLFQLDEQPAASTRPLQVQVIGHQWWWEFAYPTDNNKNTDCTITTEDCIRTANELVIPADRNVNLLMRSEDVIHSFWPPALAGKVDVTSGHTNFMTVQANEPGEFYGQCAEFCGLSHANMRFRVFAKTDGQYAKWWAEQTQGPASAVTEQAKQGEQLFMAKGCAGCHRVDGVSQGTMGPNLTHFMSRQRFAGSMFETNDLNLRRWLRNPPEEKPGSKMPNLNLTEEEITSLIAYLDALK